MCAYSFLCLTIFLMSCWSKYKEKKSRAVFFVRKDCRDGEKLPVLFTSQSTSSYDYSCTSESFLFLDGNFYFFVFSVFVTFLHTCQLGWWLFSKFWSWRWSRGQLFVMMSVASSSYSSHIGNCCFNCELFFSFT